MTNASKTAEIPAAEGFHLMGQSSLVICGIARDCGPELERLIPKLEKLGESFARYEVLAAENDSEDDTRAVLDRWAKHNPAVSPIFFDFAPGSSEESTGGWFDRQRVERICAARNHYMEALESRQADYVVVADLDLLDFSLNGIATSFSDHDNWHVSAGNGMRYTLRAPLRRHVYWDTYAYEPADGFPGGVQTLESIRSQQRTLADTLKNGHPLPARSAFGGLCIYRHAELTGHRYRAITNSDSEIPVLCEHVALHRDMHSRNPELKLVINPSQTVVYERPRETLRRTITSFLR